MLNFTPPLFTDLTHLNNKTKQRLENAVLVSVKNNSASNAKYNTSAVFKDDAGKFTVNYNRQLSTTFINNHTVPSKLHQTNIVLTDTPEITSDVLKQYNLPYLAKTDVKITPLQSQIVKPSYPNYLNCFKYGTKVVSSLGKINEVVGESKVISINGFSITEAFDGGNTLKLDLNLKDSKIYELSVLLGEHVLTTLIHLSKQDKQSVLEINGEIIKLDSSVDNLKLTAKWINDGIEVTAKYSGELFTTLYSCSRPTSPVPLITKVVNRALPIPNTIIGYQFDDSDEVVTTNLKHINVPDRVYQKVLTSNKHHDFYFVDLEKEDIVNLNISLNSKQQGAVISAVICERTDVNRTLNDLVTGVYKDKEYFKVIHRVSKSSIEVSQDNSVQKLNSNTAEVYLTFDNLNGYAYAIVNPDFDPLIETPEEVVVTNDLTTVFDTITDPVVIIHEAITSSDKSESVQYNEVTKTMSPVVNINELVQNEVSARFYVQDDRSKLSPYFYIPEGFILTPQPAIHYNTYLDNDKINVVDRSKTELYEPYGYQVPLFKGQSITLTGEVNSVPDRFRRLVISNKILDDKEILSSLSDKDVFFSDLANESEYNISLNEDGLTVNGNSIKTGGATVVYLTVVTLASLTSIETLFLNHRYVKN